MEAAEAILTTVVLWLQFVAEAMSVLLISVGMVVAAYQLVRVGRVPNRTRYVQLRLTMARFLVVALEFQLAADILGTAVETTWVQLGRLGAIAVIRTFLAYFLEREMREMSHSEREMADIGAA